MHILTCHPNMTFSFEQEKNGKLSFLDVEISRQQGKFIGKPQVHKKWFTGNLPLVAYMVILIVFCRQCTNLI